MDTEERSFEEIASQLEKIVEMMEGGDLPLEKTLELFEEGIKLSRAGQQKLDDAEERIETVLSATRKS